MADNLTTQSATPATIPASSTIATDDVGGAHFQKVKIDVGGDGASAALSNSNPLPVSDAGGSLTVDASSLPLPTGASTSAKQDTLSALFGDALTALQLIDNIPLQEDVAHQTGDYGVQVLAVRDDTLDARSGAENDYEPLHTDENGALWTKDVNSAAALTAVQKIDDPVLVDDAAFTPATSSVMMAGFEADESSPDSVDEGDAGAARMTLDRKVIVTPQPHTAGGLAIFRSLDLDETEEDVKTSAGQLYGWWITNLATSVRYVKIYNATAANVTVGSTTPVITIPVPAASSGGVAANALGAMGIAFDTAISAAATTGLADADTGAPGAGEVVINLFYK